MISILPSQTELHSQLNILGIFNQPPIQHSTCFPWHLPMWFSFWKSFCCSITAGSVDDVCCVAFGLSLSKIKDAKVVPKMHFLSSDVTKILGSRVLKGPGRKRSVGLEPQSAKPENESWVQLLWPNHFVHPLVACNQLASEEKEKRNVEVIVGVLGKKVENSWRVRSEMVLDDAIALHWLSYISLSYWENTFRGKNRKVISSLEK